VLEVQEAGSQVFKQPGRTGGHGAVGLEAGAELVMLDVIKVVPGAEEAGEEAAEVASRHRVHTVFVEVM